MVVRIDRAIEAVTKQRAEVVRKPVGIDAFPLDQSGIAERRFLGGAPPVDERDCAAALLQVKRDANANDPRTQNNRVAAH